MTFLSKKEVVLFLATIFIILGASLIFVQKAEAACYYSWCGDNYCDDWTYDCYGFCPNGYGCDCDWECASHNCSGGVCQSAAYCSDSDGYNFFTYGYCYDTYGYHYDFCSGNYAYDYYCSGSYCYSGYLNCNNYDTCSGAYYYDYYCSGGKCTYSYSRSCSCVTCGSCQYCSGGYCYNYCSGTDTNCGCTSCTNCNSYDGCSGAYWYDYYCSGTSCTYSYSRSCSCVTCGSCQYCSGGYCYNYCSGTDTSCGCTSCTNCNSYDGCVGVDYYDYYCSGTSCTYSISYNDSRCCKAQGSTCTLSTECCSGYCKDGYCCNQACTGLCQTCNLSATYKGTCYCYYSGDDPENECYGTGTCGGTCNGSCGCQYPGTSISCGTKDCDYLDTTCRNYHDVTRYCNGAGSCGNPACNSYTNASAGTKCGTCQTCNGLGSCNQTPADDSDCGTIDCDGLDTYFQSPSADSPTGTDTCWYRNYSDLTSNRCEGFGDCKDPNSADCTSYSDTWQYDCGYCQYIPSNYCTGGTKGSCSYYAKGTSCTTNKECDGSGNCVNCAPPSGTISASKTAVNIGEQFTITVTGNDDNDVWYLYAKEGAAGTWDSQLCLDTQTSCTKTWNFTKTTAGTYQYYGWVIDSDDVHGCSSYHESATTPTYVTVTVSKKPNGATCASGTECQSTFCVDGYCCDSSCTGVCRSCVISGYLGSCRCYYSGDDPENECPTATCKTGNCDGNCGCGNTAAGSDCGTCKTCDGSGSCNQTPADDSDCGTIDCDGLDSYYQSGTESPTATEDCYYRNCNDLTTNRCEGFGDCKDPNTADCTDCSDTPQYSCGLCQYISATNCTGGTKGSCSNYADGTSCETNKSCDGGVCKTDTKIDCYFGATTCIFDKDTVTVEESVWVCGTLRTEGGTAISGETISLWVRTDGSYDKVFDVGTTDANGYACKSWSATDDLFKYDDPKYIGIHKYILFFAGNDYNQSQTSEYNLTITCDPTCESPGAVGGYIAPLHCATCQGTCGWICYRAAEIPMGYATVCTIGTDCKFPIYPYTIIDNRGTSCSGSATICQTSGCPNYSGWNGENCTTRKTNCSHILYGDFGVVNYGYWDAYDMKCVQCDANHKETANCGDTSGIYLECNYGERENAPCTGTADNKCESACGASFECDEKSPGDNCGIGKECDDSCQCVAYRPDLIITDIWDSSGTIKYTIMNQGNGDAGESYTALYVDGTYTEYDYVASLSAGSSSYGESFPYDWRANCTGESDLIQVCADYFGPRIDEKDETNNCAPPETWICDATPPTTTISPNGTDWVNYDVNFTLTCTDGGSGCQTTQYKIIDESQTCDTSGLTTGTSGTVTCSVNQACRKKVCFRSVDNAGNPEDIKTSNLFKIDKAAPTTEVGP